MLITVLALLNTGCISTTFTSPDGMSFKRVAVGNKTTFGNLLLETTTNGVRRIQLKGYSNDQVEALSAVTEAAVRAAVSSAKP